MHEARQGFDLAAGFRNQQEWCRIGGQAQQLGAQLLRHAAAAVERRELARGGVTTELACPPRVERTLDGWQQFGERQGLLDEIEGTEPRGLDRGLDRAVSGHHHHRAVIARVVRPLAQQRDAVGVRHPDVEQHQVRGTARARSARLGGVGGNLHVVAFLAEDLL